ncbi:MAG: tryptophan synthase subunit alpha [Gammaproteobacteria bacterium]|nr:tryptophan synthase subunit alpha [Gammaproteobacteria bacterium]
MSRIGARFSQLAGEARKALIPYLTAGDPNPDFTVPLMHAMVEAGADILEVGVPFSDPMAEGPVIQHAMERALLHHVSLQQVIDMVATFRTKDATTPVLLMGYLNPVEVMGYETFVNKASAAGIDGVLLVDLPPEEAEALLKYARPAGLDVIFLVAPTTTPQRMKTIAATSSGFVYYVSLKGVTGAGHLNTEEVQRRVTEIKSVSTLPVGVGFGIKDGASAKSIAAVADAVVVGSALVRLIEANIPSLDKTRGAVADLISEMRHAMDGDSRQSAVKMQS